MLKAVPLRSGRLVMELFEWGFSVCQRTLFLEFRCKGTNIFRGVRCLAVFSGGFRAIMVFNGELNELHEGYVGYYITAN